MERVVFTSSLYPQYEVEVDGKVFHLKPICREVFDALADMTKKAMAGNIEAVGGLYDQMGMVLDAPQAFINKLDYRVVRQFIRFVNDKLIQAEVTEEQKNGPKPGETVLPS